ncbi:MAG: 50S ribosomal protein L11 methyltransferase [Bacteroidales bacterium]|nr:50S ribosomal protein L11 methyltransferase [Bacteroidales bacterium]
MDYIEVKCKLPADNPLREPLMAELSERGFESFMEEEDQLTAYIPEESFSPDLLENLTVIETADIDPGFEYHNMKEKNWNEDWERDYPPAIIADRCVVRASFHSSSPIAEYEIIIDPRMSFGTAHHETTALMIELMLDEDFRDKEVLDMGSGTGILAILAEKKGAAKVVAIDNNDWAYENSKDNLALNNSQRIDIHLGDAALLGGRQYDIILANINRNVLLEDIAKYDPALKQKGKIYLSGFYKDDMATIRAEAEKQGWNFESLREKNKWVAAIFNT